MTPTLIKNTMLVLREKMGDTLVLEDETLSRESIVGLIHLFEKNIDDVRVQGRCTFKLHHLLIIVFLAVLSGFSNCTEFVWFCQKRYALLEKLGLVRDEIIPSHDTFRRILILVDPKQLQQAMLEELEVFFQQVEKHFDVEGKYIQLAVDGKELRGTGRQQDTQKPSRNIQTLNVYNVSRGICLFCSPIEEKTNEIPVAREILNQLQLNHTIISADALHSTRETAQLIADKKGSYFFNIKENQRLTKQEIISVFDKYPKKINVLYENDEKKKEKGTARKFEIIRLWKTYIGEDWPDQRAYVRMTNAKGNVYYFLTSIKEDEAIIEAAMNRWKIENDLHRHKDLLFHEDAIRYINRTMVNNLAIINNLALSFVNVTQEVEKCETKKLTKKVLIMEGTTLPFKIIKLIGSKEMIKKMGK